MAEPTVGELPQAKFVTVAETPIYVKEPDGEVRTVTLKAASKRGAEGIDNAVLLMRQKSRRRGEDEYLKPLDNLNDLEQVDWDKVGGLRYQDADGEHIITKDQISLEEPKLDQLDQLDQLGKTETAEPKAARAVLENLSGVPTLTIVGLKAYEVRAHDLADKSMQLPRSETTDFFRKMLELKRTIWKHSLGHTYFHEKSRQYYMDMLKRANSPFAAESIKAAEAAGLQRYDDLLKNSDFLTRAGTRFVDYIKSNLGLRSMVQRFALEEIGHMREQDQIKEAASFERESTATRKRFEQDFDRQDNFIRKTLGEKLELADEPIAADIRGLVRRYASGEIATKEAFDAEVKTFYETKLKSARPDVFQQAELYSSSLYDVAETLRTRASHDAGLANIDSQINGMQVRLGMGVMGEATQLEPTAVKKGTEAINKSLTWLEKKGIIGPLFNEATVSSGVALALTFGFLPKMVASWGARTMYGFGGGIAAGAIFGGIREYRQLQREYLTHMREREAGLTFAPDAKRRAWMERFYLSQRSSDDLTRGLEADDLQTKLATLADAKARKNLSAREKQRYGLIRFSDLENIETQRTALDVAVDRTEQQLLASGKVEKQFLDDLTAAQTRVLTEGIETLAGLDDPMKVTLGLLSKYNPEVEIMRRRFPLLGPEYKTGEKATGMEEILKEFRRASLGASVRKGLVVGLSGAIIGTGIREGLQLGLEGADRLGLHLFTVTNNLRVEAGNLNVVDANGKVIHDAVVKDLESHLTYKNSTFSEETMEYIRKQGEPLGLKFEFSATHSPVEFSGATRPLPDVMGKPIDAPEELHWVFKDDDIRQLVVDAKDGTQHVIFEGKGGPGDPSGALAAIRNSKLFDYTPEQTINTPVDPQPFALTEIAPIGDHNFEASIPVGTELHQTAPGVYELVKDDETLLSGIKINEYGKITNISSLRDAAAEHGLVLDNSDATLLKVEGESALDPFDKVVGTMGEEKGFHGPWGWLEDPINASKDIEHHLPGTNLAKNLFRGTYENYYHAGDKVTGTFRWDIDGSKVNYNAMQADTTFHDVPGAIFRDEQLVKLGGIMDEAIRMREVDGVPLDALHQAAYAIGREGRVATAAEVRMFIDALGGKTEEETINVFRPIIEQTITETTPAVITGVNSEIVTNVISLAETPVVPEIPWIPLPLVGRRPLEQMVPAAILQQYPENPQEYFQEYGEYPLTEGYGQEYPVIYPAHAVYIPFYELAFDKLNISETERVFLRKLPPGERIKKLYERTDQVFDESLPYEDQVIILSQTLDVSVEQTRPLTPKEVIQKRLDNQTRYLENLRSRWTTTSNNPRVVQTLYRINGATKDYMSELEDLNASLPAMHPDCRMSVIIPAFNEGKRIEQTLKGWLNQFKTNTDERIDPNSFEIILFLNKPNESVSFDQTRVLVEQLKSQPEYADYHVHIVEKTFNISDTDRQVTINNQNVTIPKGRRMGLIYSIPTDLAIMRNIARSGPDDIKANHIFKAGGADAYSRSPHYIDEVTSAFDGSTDLEQLNSRADYPASIYKHVPLFHVAERFRESMNERYSKGKTNLGLGVIRTSLYAEAGGFNPTDDIAEEVRLNERMRKTLLKRARRQGKTREDVIRRDETLRAIDNPRRALSAVWQGVPMLYDYTNFWNNTVVRTTDVEEILKRPVPSQAKLTKENLTLQLEPYVQYYTRLIYLYHPDRSIRGNMGQALSLARQYTNESLTGLGFRPTDYTWQVENELDKKTGVENPKTAVRSLKLTFDNLDGVNAYLDQYRMAEKPEWTK